jgi:SAM-dependent methyltransferase
MKLNEINFQSYANIEAMENFSGPEEIQAYRQRRLDRYKDHITFIMENCAAKTDGKGFRVMEVGSGNSGLLYALNLQIKGFQGYGVEISTSRWKFAEKWKADEKIGTVENINQNFSDVSADIRELNSFIVIDNTFSYLAPENAQYPQMLVRTAFERLQSGGTIVIDVINYDDRMKKGSETFWTQFPDSDPFKYGLYSFDVVDQQTVVTKSVFIKRNLTEEVKVDVSRFYRAQDLHELLKKEGFEVLGTYGSFKKENFDPVKSQRLVVLARKSH